MSLKRYMSRIEAVIATEDDRGRKRELVAYQQHVERAFQEQLDFARKEGTPGPMATLHREDLRRTSTADLSRQVDQVLDCRYVQVAEEPYVVATALSEPRPFARMRTLFRNLGSKN